MKPLLILCILIFCSFGMANTNAPQLAEKAEVSEQTGTISGVVQLASKSKGVRSGGGLYGRPGRSPVQTSSSDSVLIILTSPDNISTTIPPPVILDQKDQKFQPSILPIRLGQTVRIQNSDPVYHNVFSLTSPHKFDVGRRPQGEQYDVTFEREGMVDVFCDIHSNMHAIIYVMPKNTVLAIKVAAGERFLINAPEGEYTIQYFALGYKESQASIRVMDGEVLSMGTVILNP